MANFSWTGKNRQGAIQKGQVTAKNREEVIGILRKQNILVTSIQEKKTSIFQMEIPGLGGGGGEGERYCHFYKTVRNHDRCRPSPCSMS